MSKPSRSERLLVTGSLSLGGVCPRLFQSGDELIHLFFSRLSGYPVAFLEPSYELLPLAIDDGVRSSSVSFPHFSWNRPLYCFHCPSI